MRTTIRAVVMIGALMISCAPDHPIVNPTNPRIERSVVPTIQEAKVTLNEASSKLGDQSIVINRLGDDVDMALQYSGYIRSYTKVDRQGVELSDGLDHSLGSMKENQTFLINSNDMLVNDIIKSSDSLQEAIRLGALKDEESIKWKETSEKKDEAIIGLNMRLANEINRSTNLRLDLEDAQVYKHIVIAIASMAFLFAVIKAALTVWSPFSKFKV